MLPTALLSPVLRSYLIANDVADCVQGVRLANDKMGMQSFKMSFEGWPVFLIIIVKSLQEHIFTYFLERGFEMIWNHFQSGLKPDRTCEFDMREAREMSLKLSFLSLYRVPHCNNTTRIFNHRTRTQVRVQV